MFRHVLRHAAVTCALIALVFGDLARVEAQPPLGARGGVVTPRRIADCDIEVESCGTDGGELYAGGGAPSSSGGGVPVCGRGKKGECNRTTVRTCTSWRITSSEGEITVENLSGLTLGAGAKLSCETWATTVDVFYWV